MPVVLVFDFFAFFTATTASTCCATRAIAGPLAGTAAAIVAPADSMYVGDIYSVDYLGATAAGMKALLLDISKTYSGKNLPRIDSLTELPAKIAAIR